MSTKRTKAVSKIAAARRRTGIASGIIISVSFVVTMILGAYLIIQQNTQTSRENVRTMNNQLSQSVYEKLEKLESVSSRIFQRQEFIHYDASLYNRADQYKNLALEKEMEEFLMSMSTVDNYNDFFFLYANNHMVGRISKRANEVFGSEMYEKTTSYLKNRNGVWFTGVNDDYSRLYYVRRINSGTVFVGSMFTDEMKTVFPKADTKHLSFVITDADGSIIYSVNRNNVTDKAIGELKKEWAAGEPVTVAGFRYAASSDSCANSWHVISVTDFSSRNARYLRIMLYCALILTSAVIVVFFVGFLLSSARMPSNLIYKGSYSTDTMDRLTGLIMNEALENVIVGKIDSCINGSTMVLLLVKIKNYELISENYGETAVDEALIKVSALLREFYGKNNTIGKMDNNEFAVLADFTDFNLFKAHERMKANIRQLEEELDKLELENDRGIIRCALGAAIYPEDSEDYDELYEHAKTALEESSQTRACKCKFYNEIKPQQKK